MTPELAKLAGRLTSIDMLRRLGQALWMMLERPVDRPNFTFARGVLGDDGDEIVWSALIAEAVLAPPAFHVNGARLASMLGRLCERQTDDQLPRLLWTLPKELHMPMREHSYSEAAISLVETAASEVVLVSPFMEPTGIGRLLDALLRALKRGVKVSIFTHGASDLSSLACAALEDLRRESRGLDGRLEVFSARDDLPILLHSKLIISDNSWAIVGSANLTGKGLAHNLEAGVLLGKEYVSEIALVVASLQYHGLVKETFECRS